MILALDPSGWACGWAAALPPAAPGGRAEVAASGVWHPSAAAGQPPPLLQLAAFVAGLAGRFAAEFVVETPDGGERYYRDAAGGRHPVKGRSERAYAQAVGVCLGAAVAAAGADKVHPVTVNQWKGNLPKTATAFVAEAYLGRPPVDHNESDAVALALAFLNGLPVSRPGPEAGRSRGRGYVDRRYAAAVARALKKG